MKKIILSLTVIFTLILILTGCNTTEPGGDNGNNGKDTTSHNYTWQKFTFGGAASSYLSDVAVVNDTSIWAVGAIYVNDSAGQVDPLPYNTVHWDGEKWQLYKINYKGIPPVIHSIFAINEHDMWFDPWFHWNGQSFQELPIDPVLIGVGVNKIWGNEGGIFIVGNNGFIAYRSYNSSWSKLESGTDLNINDVWGIVDKDGKEVVLCAAYNFGSGAEKKLLRIKDSKVDEIPWVNKELSTVWFNTVNKVYAGGEGLYVKNGNDWESITLPNYFIFRIRGDGENNIIATGGIGFTAHFNGANWKVIEEAELTSGNYEGLAVKGNTVALVGFEGNAAAITIGKRI